MPRSALFRPPTQSVGDFPVSQQHAKSTSVGSLRRYLRGLFLVGQKLHLPSVGLVLLTVAYAAVHLLAMWRRFDGNKQPTFDLGIFTQGVWLLSQGETPFVTLRGLHLFGDHASYILLLVAPLYGLISTPKLLLFLQAVSVASPALILGFGLRRWVGRNSAAFFGVLYLALPVTAWVITSSYHPESFAAGFLAGAIVTTLQKRLKLTALLLALSLFCKEDVAFLTFLYGITLAWCGHRRFGFAVSAVSIGYFVLVTQVLMPEVANTHSPHFLLNFNVDSPTALGVAQTLPQLAQSLVSNLSERSGWTFLILVFLPLGFLGFLAPRWLLPALAPLGTNLLTVLPHLPSIQYHYLLTAGPFLITATAFGYVGVRSRLRKAWAQVLLPGLLILALVLSAFEGPYVHVTRSILHPPQATPELDRLLGQVSASASIAASDSVATKLAHRKNIYLYPNPFRSQFWGWNNEPASAEQRSSVEYLVFDQGIVNEEHAGNSQPLFESLLATGNWELVEQVGTIGLWKRSP